MPKRLLFAASLVERTAGDLPPALVGDLPQLAEALRRKASELAPQMGLSLAVQQAELAAIEPTLAKCLEESNVDEWRHRLGAAASPRPAS